MSVVTSPNVKRKYGVRNFERFSWLFMRVTGLFMFLAITFHLLYMHMVVKVENITFDNIVDRWTGPLGLVWKVFDLSILLVGMLHGYNGVRWVINDYVHHKGWNLALRLTLYTIGGILIAAGLMVLAVGPGSLR
jgi:succinate dehydrogenase / fumarate reductase membrane anchor subunit